MGLGGVPALAPAPAPVDSTTSILKYNGSEGSKYVYDLIFRFTI